MCIHDCDSDRPCYHPQHDTLIKVLRRQAEESRGAQEKYDNLQVLMTEMANDCNNLETKVSSLTTLCRELILELIAVCPDKEHERFHKQQLEDLEAKS